MKWIDQRPTPLWAPDGMNAGGAPEGAAPPAPPAAVSDAAAADGQPPADPGTPAGDAQAWWEVLPREEKDFVLKKGMESDDPDAARQRMLRGWRAAEQKLGRPADATIDRPAEGQSVGEWMRANAKTFGLPEAPDGYQIEAPNLPGGVEWDTTLEAEARALAHKNGLPPAALQDMVNLYAAHVGSLYESAQTETGAANAEMMDELRNTWGEQAPARLNRARLAAQAVSEKAGLGADGLAALSMRLKNDTGDADVIRLFDAIGDMMGEDGLVAGAGGAGFTATPAETRAHIARFNQDIAAAQAAGKTAEVKRLVAARAPLYEQL